MLSPYLPFALFFVCGVGPVLWCCLVVAGAAVCVSVAAWCARAGAVVRRFLAVLLLRAGLLCLFWFLLLLLCIIAVLCLLAVCCINFWTSLLVPCA
jgi:hypothetical protein